MPFEDLLLEAPQAMVKSLVWLYNEKPLLSFEHESDKIKLVVFKVPLGYCEGQTVVKQAPSRETIWENITGLQGTGEGI